MKKLWIAFLACTFAFSALGEESHTLTEGYYLGSAYVGQESGSLLAEASREGFSSILVWRQGPEVLETWPLSDLRVNALGWVSEEDLTFFVSGSTGESRVTRIYQMERQRLVNLWDSMSLPDDLGDAEILLSRDGRLWSAVSYGQSSADIAVGPTTGYQTTKTWSLEYGDGPFGDPLHSSSVILNSDPENPALALLWCGVLQVLGGPQSVRHLEIPEDFEVSGLYFQERANILWGRASYSRLLGFDLKQLAAEGKQDTAGRARFRIYPERLGVKGFTNLAEHPSGDLLMQAQTGQRNQALVRLDPRTATDHVFEVTPMRKGSRIAGWGVLSPSSDSRVEWEVRELPLENQNL